MLLCILGFGGAYFAKVSAKKRDVGTGCDPASRPAEHAEAITGPARTSSEATRLLTGVRRPAQDGSLEPWGPGTLDPEETQQGAKLLPE